MRLTRLTFGLLLAAASPPASTQATPALTEAAGNMAGTWDLVWVTRTGPQKSGYLLVSHTGNRISARIYGQGSVKASGTVTGQSFTLRGRRMAVPYLIAGTFAGERIAGSLKVLSVEKRFTGTRRR